MQGPGAGLRKVPDIVLENFDGPQSYLLIDVKTFEMLPVPLTLLATTLTACA